MPSANITELLAEDSVLEILEHLSDVMLERAKYRILRSAKR